MSKEEKYILDWEKINQIVENLATQISKSTLPIGSISGIPRGGLIPAVLLSHKLGLPYTTRILPNTLIVDDIADTGETLDRTIAVYSATLIFKPHTSKIKPTFYGDKHEGNEWIIFPWEKEDSKPIQGYLDNP